MDVQIGDQLAQQDNEDQTPFEFDFRNLQNMPEDCLLEIFSKKSLELMDLCSIGETSQRLKRIVRRAIIPKSFGFTMTGSLYEVSLGKYNHTTDKRRDIKRIFNIFGPCLATLSISISSAWLCELSLLEKCADSKDDWFLLDAVNRYCGDELKSLSMNNVRISEDFTPKLKTVFKRLETLHLYCVYIEEDMSLFARLDAIVELEMAWVENGAAVLQNAFPTLERLTCCKDEMTDAVQTPHMDQSLEVFCCAVSRFDGLKKLNVRLTVDDGTCWTSLLQTIANCTELEDLQITNMCRLSSTSLQPLQRLKSLRILELWNVSFDNLEVFAPMTQLSELVLHNCQLPPNPDNFRHLTQLTELLLNGCGSIEGTNLVEIIRQLVKLEELEIHDVRTLIDRKTFSEIVAVVSGRPKTLTLNCAFAFDWKKCNETQAVTLLSTFDSEVF